LTQKIISSIRSNYEQVREKIASSARTAGRVPNSVRLIVVTKTHSIATVRAALEAGILDLGENYAEEAEEKILAIGKTSRVIWHMIGHVQSRKADLVARYFDYVHSVDSVKLANRLNRFAAEVGRRLPILLECNVGGEDSKFGYPAFDQSSWVNLTREAEQISALPNIEIRGLMTMPPFNLDARQTRPYFIRLRELSEYLAVCLPQAGWDELSMGTSVDYEVAVEEGATIVRVGTAILGERPPKTFTP